MQHDHPVKITTDSTNQIAIHGLTQRQAFLIDMALSGGKMDDIRDEMCDLREMIRAAWKFPLEINDLASVS